MMNQLFFVCLLFSFAYQLKSFPNNPTLSEDSENVGDSYDEEPGLGGLTHDYENIKEDANNPDILDSEHSFADIFNPMNSVFPEVKGDLTLITWNHAVNSQEKLKKALNGSAMMLEADVILGYLKGDPQKTQLPVMGHPPDVESDLSLDQFITKVASSQTNKGIKLDFKSDEAFMAAQQILDTHNGATAVPIWLNADILPGPVDATVSPVSADLFLNTSVKNFPDSMLSIGWTTHYAADGKYTEDQINNMANALNRNNVQKAVTFPVRAVFATESADLLQYLVNTSPAGSTLTVWMSNEADPVNIPRLRKLLETIGKNKVYLDVPDKIRERLNSKTDSGCGSLRNSFAITAITMLVLSALYFH